MKARGVAAAALMTTWLAAYSTAAQLVYQADPESAFVQLERDIPSLYLLNGLYLTPEQNSKLAGLLEQAGALEKKTYQRMLDLERRYDADFLREAEKLARGAPEERRAHAGTLRQLREAREEAQAVQRDWKRELDGLSRQAYDLLTPAQREIMYVFEPCFIPAADFKNPVRVGQAAGDTSFGEKIFDRLRLVREDRLDQAKEEALERMIPYVMHQSHIRYSEEAEQKVYRETRGRLEKALPRIRELNDVDYELEKAALVRQVLPIEAEDHATAEEYQQALWKTGVYLLNPGCLATIRARGTNPARAAGKPYVGPTAFDIRGARERLQMTRVVARLDLTPGQAGEVLPVIRAGARAAKDVEDAASREKREAVFVYEDLKQELAAGSPTPGTEEKAGAHHHNVKKLYEEDLVSAIKPYENQLDKILTAGQVAMLMGQGRSGQPPQQPTEADRKERKLALETLNRARQISASEFQRTKQHLAGVFIADCLDEDGNVGGVDVPAETARAVAVLERARGLSGPQYRTRLPDLVVELCPRRTVARPASYGDKYYGGQPMEELDSSSRLIFTEAAATMIEKAAGK